MPTETPAYDPARLPAYIAAARRARAEEARAFARAALATLRARPAATLESRSGAATPC